MARRASYALAASSTGQVLDSLLASVLDLQRQHNGAMTGANPVTVLILTDAPKVLPRSPWYFPCLVGVTVLKGEVESRSERGEG